MIPTIVIGLLFAALLAYGIRKTIQSAKSNRCPGCGGGCSASQAEACHSSKKHS